MHMTPQILNQLIWNQIIVAFGWNRSPSGDVLVVTEPVSEALAQAVADLIVNQPQPEMALANFVAKVEEHVAAGPRPIASSSSNMLFAPRGNKKSN